MSITAPANNFKPNAPATINIAANAADADGGVSKVEFFRINPAAPVFDATTKLAEDAAAPYQYTWSAVSPGTYTLVARAIDNEAAVATSASVQVIVNALPTVTLTSPLPGASIQLGTTVTLRAIASDADGSINKVEFFLNGSATPLGQGLRVGSTNEYTFNWLAATQGAYSFTARATDNDNATQTTASVSVNVPANAPPAVTLDAPVAGANSPTNLELSAVASDSDGTVASVQFFDGSTSLGLGTLDPAGAPAPRKWRRTVAVPASQADITYSVTAVATDDRGATTTTASQSKTIAANVPPSVALTSPAAATLPVNATTGPVTLTATATDTDGIAKVEFFNGASKVGEATTAPYQFAWAGVAAGSYSITARAVDTVGSATTTPVQTLVVTPNVEGLWANLNTAQKAGHTRTPNRPVEAGGVDAVEVMTVIGVTTVIPKFSAAMSQAALSLARTIPPGVTAGFVPCAGGGTIQVFQNGANRGVNLNSCVAGGFTFYGGGGVAPYVQYDTTTSTTAVPPATAPVHPNPNCVLEVGPPRRWRCSIGSAIDWNPITDGFRLIVQGVRVTGNGAPDPGGKDYPRNAFGYTRVDCTGIGAAQTCMTIQDVSFWWGYDLAWTDYNVGAMVDPVAGLLYATDDTYRLNGTHRSHYCSPDPDLPNNGRDACLASPPTARHIKFENMTHNSGRAIVYGSNGWSVVTRIAPESPGVERLQVRRTLTQAATAGGITYPVGTGPLEIYRCTVGAASGDWSCTFVSSTP